MPKRGPVLRWLHIGDRGRMIAHTGSWSLVAQAAAAANLLLSIPFVLTALGPAQFGAWATLVALVTFTGFLDFGIGNGAMNLVAAAHGRGSIAEVAAVAHEGRKMLARLGIVLAATVLAALPIVPWHRLLGLPTAMEQGARLAAAFALLAIVISVPLNLAQRVQLGLGRGDRAYQWQAAGQLLTLATVAILARWHASLPVLTAAAVAPPMLASLINARLAWRDPMFAHAHTPQPGLAQRIRNEGMLFFALQLAAALALSSDLPLISSMLGSSEAGTYAIVQRMFSIIPLVLGLVWAPLWPAYRQALAVGHYDWALRTLHRSMAVAVIFAACMALALMIGCEPIIAHWVQHPLAVSGTLLAGFAVWSVLNAAGNALGTFLNAASLLRFQVTVAALFAASCLAAKILVISSAGISPLPWMTAITYSTTTLLPAWLLWPRLKREVHSKNY
ncbi:MAG: hypothetical protein E6R00_01305 [Gammaproteobacteria bacterium]|nr:MAG: hypothetical protein E6R00_01305 [Gammaproteobacteria bacterium]